MRNGMRLGLCVVLLASFAAELRADVAPSFRWPWEKKPATKTPPPPPAFTTEPFIVELIDDDKESAVLQLTPSFYKSLRRITMDDVPTDVQKAEAPTVDETPPTRWAVAGAALALALGFGGLWLRQSGSSVWKIRFVLLLGLSVAGAMGGAVVMASRPMPTPAPESKANAPKPPIENPLRVELIDQKNDMVKIRISRKQMEKLLEATKPMPKKEEGPKLPPPPPPPIVFPTEPKM